MSEPESPQESSPVTETWQQAVQALLAIALLAGVAAMFHYYSPGTAQGSPPDDLQNQLRTLKNEVAQLQREQSMPALVLSHYRNSVGYISGVYDVGFTNKPAAIRARVSGTGFLVGDGLLATNRHVAEPWYGDTEAQTLIERGATATLESMVVFFPGSPTPVSLMAGAVSSNGDLAVLKIPNKDSVRGLAVLPLSKGIPMPGELVTVIGYPMGVAGMVAKSPTEIYQRLAYRHNDMTAVNELAALSLIRPSTTCGHLGDVVGDKLIYDAPTAHGGSGGPVFNSRAEVIGVNSAYIDGFSGGTLGFSADELRPLIAQAQKQQ